MARRSGFRRQQQRWYAVAVVVEDGGYPVLSSTATLSVQVCSCRAGGALLSCSAEAVFLPVGLSTGALVAILLCVVILLGEWQLAVAPPWQHERKHGPPEGPGASPPVSYHRHIEGCAVQDT